MLPVRADNKLVFGLCGQCITQKNKRKCTHNDRTIVGDFSTMELSLAVEMGYIIVLIYEVLHWSHLVRITKDFQNIDKYFGVAKIKIKPPKKL